MRLDRLHTLYEFLTLEKIPNREWTFSTINRGEKNNGFDCGTAGCAMGEFSLIWPDIWQYSSKYDLQYKSTNDIGAGVQEFFVINSDEYHNILEYTESSEIYDGSENLTSDSTRSDVAANLKKFITKAMNGELHSQKSE